jgi:hypothetical protein
LKGWAALLFDAQEISSASLARPHSRTEANSRFPHLIRIAM